MKTNFEDNEEFFSLPFYVDSRVLVPRNDTETMIYQVLKENFSDFSIIDVWTWSSCIPVAIIKNLKIQAHEVFALDISPEALEVAKINLEKHNLQDKINLQKSDLLEMFLDKKLKINSKNLIITANLPYIKDWDFENMDIEVLENEPHIALFGWKDTWFEIYEKLIWQIFKFKNLNNLENIHLFIEIWFDQKEYSNSYLENLNLKHKYFKDFNWIDRIIKICF